MRPTIVINVVGLTPRMIGPDTPVLRRLATAGGLRKLETAFPAVTCTAQTTFLTGVVPRDHGIVGNGWYFRELAEVLFWRQSNRLVTGTSLGRGQAARSGLYLRQSVLVVQHVFDGRHRRDAAADVSRRRPQDTRLLHGARACVTN